MLESGLGTLLFYIAFQVAVVSLNLQMWGVRILIDVSREVGKVHRSS